MTVGKSIIIDTPDGIAFYRLAAFSKALKVKAETGRDVARISATKVGKRDYNMHENTSAGQLRIVEPVVEAILRFRECAPELQTWLMYQFSLCVNACLDSYETFGAKELKQEVRLLTVPTKAEKEVLNGLCLVYAFESRAGKFVRVLFRDPA